MKNPRKTRGKDTNRGRIAARERTMRTIEKYQGKLALMATWEKIDKDYYHKLKAEAHKLRESLTIKGVL